MAQVKGRGGEGVFKVAEGRPDRGKVVWSSTSQSGVQEMVDEPHRGPGHVVG